MNSRVIDRIIQTYFCERNLPVKFGGLTQDGNTLRKLENNNSGCVFSWHGGLIGKFYLKNIQKYILKLIFLLNLDIETSVLEGVIHCLLLYRSQVKTADTLAGIRQAKSKFIKSFIYMQCGSSSIARESDSNIEPWLVLNRSCFYKAYTMNLRYRIFCNIFFTIEMGTTHQNNGSLIAEILKST